LLSKVLDTFLGRRETLAMHPKPPQAGQPVKPGDPVNLGDRARDDLRFIRNAMERGTAFSAVPGWGGVAMGVTALIAAGIAAVQPSPERWLGVWLVEALMAISVGGWALHRKAAATELAVLSGAGRKFFLSFLPPAFVGAALTLALAHGGSFELIPAVWLLTYGAAVITAGAFSVRAVPLLGMAFMVLGAGALLLSSFGAGLGASIGTGIPDVAQVSHLLPFVLDGLLALGFGGLHIGFGLYIARKHGG